MSEKNKKQLSELDLLKSISEKLDTLIYATSLQNKTSEQKVKLLSKLDFGNKQIGQISGLSVKDVENIKSRKLKKNPAEQ